MKVTPETVVQRFGAGAVGQLEPHASRPAWVDALPVLVPATQDEASEMLRCAASEGWRVLPAGAGEHLGEFPWVPPAGVPAPGPDVLLSCKRLVRVIEYEPEEMVAVVEAGVPLNTLAALAAPHGQRLPTDTWPGRAATLGGAVAANRAGLDRLRRGTPREAVLGMRVLHADGTGSKTGGKVVKNVTGYDLAKLYTGSLGALVWIAEVNLRLVPTPASSALVVASVAREQAEARLLALHRSPLQPTASLALAGDACEAIPVPSGEIVLVARFEGNEAAVRYQVEEALRLWGGETWQAERAAPVVEALQANLDARPGAVSLRIASMPVMGLRALECFEGSTPWETGGGLVAQFGAGIAVAHLPGNTNSSELGALVARLHSQGSAVTLLGTPGNRAIRLAAGSNGLDEVALDLVQRTKRAFDPIGILPPYNGVGGWR